MKKIIIVTSLVLLISCNSVKNIEKEKINQTGSLADKSFISCPEDGLCTIELLKDKTLLVKKDDLGHNYYQTTDSEGYSVFKYTYTRKKAQEVQDNSYVEEIIFEIKNPITKLELSDLELQNIKMLFGRHCFCKGQAGYYTVNKGNLVLIKNSDSYHLNVNINVTEVPQIINAVTATF